MASYVQFIAGGMVLALAAGSAAAQYQAPDPAYGPGSYYSSINTASPGTLKSQLTTRLNTGFNSQSYDSIRTRFGNLDGDPANSNNILLIYNRASVSKTWDAGTTYNREHIWPDSRLPNNAADSDYFNLRPANPSINSSRSNAPFGSTTSSGGYGYQTPGVWYPGDADAGDVARSQFYMATKYANDGLALVNGSSVSGYQMGDLQSLLKWHYTDGIDNFERRRNHNVQTFQGNRNPYIDHPEYVWAVFGGGSNNSQITVSSTSVNLGSVIKGAPLASSTVTINKTGAHPTTYNLLTTGSATTAAAGSGQAFNYNTQSRVIPVGLNASTATAGLKSGSITLDNTDLTSGGAGQGSADANDVITVSASVLDHSNASFGSIDANTTAIDLGIFDLNEPGEVTLDDVVRNLVSTAGFTAALDLDGISGFSGQTGKIDVDGLFTQLAAGQAGDLLTTVDTTAMGDFSATYRLLFSDQNLPGATAFGSESLYLTLSATVVPEPTTLTLLTLGAIAMLRRRRI